MEIELRPLSAGEVLDRTFRMYRAQFGVFVGIATLAAMIDTAGTALQTFAIRFATRHEAAKVLAGALSVISIFVEFFVAMVAAAVVFAAIAHVVLWLHEGRPVGIASGIRSALPRWYRYVLLAVVHWLLSAWPFLVVTLLLVPVGVVGARAGAGSRSEVFAGVMVGWFLLMTLCVPLCVWLYCRYALCISASALEDLSIGKSLRRSVLLSKGLRWRIFLLVAVVYVLQMILVTGLTLPVIGVIVYLTHSHGQLPLAAVLYQLAIGFVIVALITPNYGIGLTLIYMDARVRKEGFDIEMKMQRSAEPPHVAAPGAQPEGPAPFAAG